MHLGDDCICKEEKNVISRDVALREEYETPSLTVLGTLAEITHQVPNTNDPAFSFGPMGV